MKLHCFTLEIATQESHDHAPSTMNWLCRSTSYGVYDASFPRAAPATFWSRILHSRFRPPIVFSKLQFDAFGFVALEKQLEV
jgi:hypothetical protein